MRDLMRALSNIKLFHYDESFVAVCDERNGMLSFPLGLVYEAIERAIKAEDRVETLRIVARESYDKAEAENARLHKVVEAARAMVNHCDTWFISGVRTTKEDLRAALAELDKDHD